MKEIQLFKPTFDKLEILAQIAECLDKSWTGIGYKTIQFEEKFKWYTKIPHAHFLNSATSGLHLALEILKREKTDRGHIVMTSPLTFISDTSVIYHADMHPYFVDIDESLCISPDKLRETLKINNRYLMTLAVIYVGIGGNTGNLEEIVKVCNEFGVPLILDASHMMGTVYNSRHIGNEGQRFTVFSFHAVKNLPTADAGMICCAREEDDKLARKLSWLGINRDTYNRQTGGGNWDYNVEDIGYKYHGNSIMAAMAIAGLKNLEYENSYRRGVAARYNEKLDNKFYRKIPIDFNCNSSRHLYQVRVNRFYRDNIIHYARIHGIQLGVHYKSHTKYERWKHWSDKVPNAELASKELISLPIGTHIISEDLERIIKVLNEYPL